MTKSRTRLLFVIAVSTIFLTLNVFAVSYGSAVQFYENIDSSLDVDY